MSKVNLLPNRIEIGQFQDSSGRTVKVYQSPEFSRLFSDLFERVGGHDAPTPEDLQAYSQDVFSGKTAATPDNLEAVELSMPTDLSGLVSSLTIQVQELQGAVLSASASASEMASMRAEVEQLRAEVAAFDRAGALGELQKAIDAARLDAGAAMSSEAARIRQAMDEAVLMAGFRDPFRVDWERPGAIGSLSRSSGAFTSVAANNGVTISGGLLRTLGGATFHTTTTALANGAAAAAGTLTNAPVAGNPSKWIGIDDNGTVRYIPAW